MSDPLDDWRSFRVDRLAEPLPTGVRSRPLDPPDAARYVSEGTAAQVPATAAVVEAPGRQAMPAAHRGRPLEAIVAHLLLLDTPFTVLEPPELRERCRASAGLLGAAASAEPDGVR